MPCPVYDEDTLMSMKVFDLQCSHGHVFEGWFRGAQAYEEQRDRGLLTCPVCADTNVERKISAARLNMGRGLAPESGQPPAQQHASRPNESEVATLTGMQAKWLAHLQEVVKRAENVGDQFASEARKMHTGETEERSIRGTATEKEKRELAEEGVNVLPLPDFLDDSQRH